MQKLHQDNILKWNQFQKDLAHSTVATKELKEKVQKQIDSF